MPESNQGASPKSHPILFSGPMVRALLDGRKTQTRRIVKGEALDWLDASGFAPAFVASPDNGMCPYGQPSDSLWVRETWAARPDYDDLPPTECGNEGIWWKASLSAWPQGYEACHGRWRPSIHMPRWASRLTLELTGVRVERLQGISDADAKAEGCDYTERPPLSVGYYTAYRELWETINGPGSWEANPWVWVLEFEVHCGNVDDLRKARAA
jgi:hypothetical protein